MEKVVVEACLSAQMLSITQDLPVEAQTHMLATEFRRTKEEAAQLQLEVCV